MTTTLHELWGPLAQILTSAFACGGFGGLVAHWLNNQPARSDPRPGAVKSTLIGAAGAWGFLFFVGATGGINDFSTLPEQLRVISVSVIAGFGARRLLPQMVDNISAKVAKLEETTSQLERTTSDKVDTLKHVTEEEHHRTAVHIANLEANMGLLAMARPDADHQQRTKALNDAIALIEKNDAQPMVWINAARALRWTGETADAIALLERFIAATDEGTIPMSPANYQAAYYNLACYKALTASAAGDESLLESALSDLANAYSKAPDKAKELAFIEQDSDLEPLRETVAYGRWRASLPISQ